MPWNKYYTSLSESVTFICGELSYYGSLLVTEKLSGRKDSYASYLDRQHQVFSEHTWTEEDSEKGDVGYKFFTNLSKVKSYIARTLEIIGEVDQLKEEVDAAPVSGLGASQVLALVKKAEAIYNESMGYYFLSQPEYTAKLNKLLLEKLGRYVPKSKLQELFLILIKSDKSTCLEIERRDWLKNILIPVKQGKINNREKNRRLVQHISVYKYLPASSQFGLWDKAHYQKLFRMESRKNLSDLLQEFHKIENEGRQTVKKQKQISARYKLPTSFLKQVETVRILSWLRLEAHLKGWAFLFYLGPLLVRQTAKIFKLPEADIFNLTLEEFLNLFAGRPKLSPAQRARRGGNILVIITPEKGCEVFWAQAAAKKYQLELAETTRAVSEFAGQAASGSGRVRGRVFVFKWGENDINKKIYKFPAGRILVAGQTMPQFMPAIRKAKAIITNEGGMLCHAAIVSRELKIPAIIGTKIATEVLKDGDEVELDLNNGLVKILKRQ